MQRDVARTKDGTPFIEWKPGMRHSLVGPYMLGPLVPAPPPEPTKAEVYAAMERAATRRCALAVAAQYGLDPRLVLNPGNDQTAREARSKVAHLMSCECDDEGGGLFSAAGIANILNFSSPDAVIRAINGLGKDWGKP